MYIAAVEVEKMFEEREVDFPSLSPLPPDSLQGLIEPPKAARGHATRTVQTAKSNMLLNLNLRDVLLRGPRRAHHDNPIAP